MVSIPQAVSAVATIMKHLKEGLSPAKVSIPQAVSAVATNVDYGVTGGSGSVSIPQAVSAVATRQLYFFKFSGASFQYRKR